MSLQAVNSFLDHIGNRSHSQQLQLGIWRFVFNIYSMNASSLNGDCRRAVLPKRSDIFKWPAQTKDIIWEGQGAPLICGW